MKEVLAFTATYNEADNIASLVDGVFASPGDLSARFQKHDQES